MPGLRAGAADVVSDGAGGALCGRRRINGEQGFEAQPGRPARRRGRGATVIEAVKLHVLHGWPRWWAWTFASLVAEIAIGILEAAAGELVIVDHVDHDVGETIH